MEHQLYQQFVQALDLRGLSKETEKAYARHLTGLQKAFPQKALQQLTLPEVLSAVFRGKFLSALENLFDQKKLSFHGAYAGLAAQAHFKQLLFDSCSHDWVVYSKPSFHSPQRVINYLGRYTHRVAISNDRLKSLTSGIVTFSYRDRRRGNVRKTMALEAGAFMRRFLLHILPKGFPKIRFFGFLGNRVRADKLSLCKNLLPTAPEPRSPERRPTSWREFFSSPHGQRPLSMPLMPFGPSFYCATRAALDSSADSVLNS